MAAELCRAEESNEVTQYERSKEQGAKNRRSAKNARYQRLLSTRAHGQLIRGKCAVMRYSRMAKYLLPTIFHLRSLLPLPLTSNPFGIGGMAGRNGAGSIPASCMTIVKVVFGLVSVLFSFGDVRFWDSPYLAGVNTSAYGVC